MILGLSVETFTLLHVLISLVGIVSGLIVVRGMLKNQRWAFWTAIFFFFTVLTSVTGFPIPPFGIDPPRIVGFLSLVLLAVAILGYYGFHRQGAWRWIYVVTSVAALYLNVFVFIIQAFQKIPFLQPLAPTQSEPPFVVIQALVLALFVGLGFLSVRRLQTV
jgi:CHASE2 domain-containing sensor protein